MASETIRVSVGKVAPVVCWSASLVRRSQFMRGLLSGGFAESRRVASDAVLHLESVDTELDGLYTILWGLVGAPPDPVVVVEVEVEVEVSADASTPAAVHEGDAGFNSLPMSVILARDAVDDIVCVWRKLSVDDAEPVRPASGGAGGCIACALCGTSVRVVGDDGDNGDGGACAECLAAVQERCAAWDAVPLAWWSDNLSVVAQFAHVYGAPVLVAHILALARNRLLPPTPDVFHLLEMCSLDRACWYASGMLDVNDCVRVGAADLMTNTLAALGPVDPVAAWHAVRRAYAWTHNIHWTLRHACVLDVSVLGTRVPCMEPKSDEPEPKRRRLSLGASSDASPSPGASTDAATTTLADALRMPLHTDVDTVLARLCAAYPPLGTPAALTDLLAAYPNLVIAGSAVAYAVSAHATCNATPGVDVDCWVLDPSPPTDDGARYAERVSAELQLGTRDRATDSSSDAAVHAAQHLVDHVGVCTRRVYMGVRPAILTLYAVRQPPVQLVHTQACSLSHLLSAFDLPHVQVGLRYDVARGRLVVEATADFCDAMQTARITWWKELKSTPDRLVRAVARGFTAEVFLACKTHTPETELAIAIHKLREHRAGEAGDEVGELAAIRVKTGAPAAYIADCGMEPFGAIDQWGHPTWLPAWRTAIAPGGFDRSYAMSTHEWLRTHAREPSAYPIRANFGIVKLPLLRVEYCETPGSNLRRGTLYVEVGAAEGAALLELARRTETAGRALLTDAGAGASGAGAGASGAGACASGAGLAVPMPDTGTKLAVCTRLALDLNEYSTVVDGVRHTTLDMSYLYWETKSHGSILARIEVEGVCEAGGTDTPPRHGLHVKRMWWYPSSYLATPCDA